MVWLKSFNSNILETDQFFIVNLRENGESNRFGQQQKAFFRFTRTVFLSTENTGIKVWVCNGEEELKLELR